MDVPPPLTRLRAAADAATALAGGAPALVADTGPAALYGALPLEVGDAVLVNIGNGHTVCLLALEGRVAGVFEHHTSAIDGPGLELRLRRWLAGDLESEEVRADHGHGAVLAQGAADGDPLRLPLIVTGPRRELLAGCQLPVEARGAARRHDAHRLLRPAARAARAARGPARGAGTVSGHAAGSGS